MFEKFKLIRKIKKLKSVSTDDAFFRFLKIKLENYVKNNPIEIKSSRYSLRVTRYAFAVLFIFIITGGATVFASKRSLPGEIFYPVKILTEKARVSLTANPRVKADLQVEFAKERVSEVKAIVEKKEIKEEIKTKRIEAALEKFEEHMSKATDVISKEKKRGKNMEDVAKNVSKKFIKEKEDVENVIKEKKDSLKNNTDKLIERINIQERRLKKEINE